MLYDMIQNRIEIWTNFATFARDLSLELYGGGVCASLKCIWGFDSYATLKCIKIIVSECASKLSLSEWIDKFWTIFKIYVTWRARPFRSPGGVKCCVLRCRVSAQVCPVFGWGIKLFRPDQLLMHFIIVQKVHPSRLHNPAQVLHVHTVLFSTMLRNLAKMCARLIKISENK